MAFFIPFANVTLDQFYSMTSPLLVYSLKVNYGMREKTFCIYGCLRVSRYVKGGRKLHLSTHCPRPPPIVYGLQQFNND